MAKKNTRTARTLAQINADLDIARKAESVFASHPGNVRMSKETEEAFGLAIDAVNALFRERNLLTGD